MAERTIIKRSIADCFEKFMKQGRVLFFSAPCGFGKTCVADALTEGLRQTRILPFPPRRAAGAFCSSMICRICRRTRSGCLCGT